MSSTLYSRAVHQGQWKLIEVQVGGPNYSTFPRNGKQHINQPPNNVVLEKYSWTPTQFKLRTLDSNQESSTDAWFNRLFKFLEVEGHALCTWKENIRSVMPQTTPCGEMQLVYWPPLRTVIHVQRSIPTFILLELMYERQWMLMCNAS